MHIYLLIILTLTPFLWLFTKSHLLGGFLPASANIFGLIAATLFLWQFLLGIRFLTKYYNKNFVKTNRLHQLIGKYSIILILIHTWGQIFNYQYPPSFIYNFNLSSQFEQNVSLGRLAYFIFLFIWILSAILRKRIKYRPWLYTHYLSYPMLFLIFLHSKNIGTFINFFPSIHAYWFLLTAIYFLLLLYRLLSFLNIFKYKYKLINIKKHAGGVAVYSLKPTNKYLKPQPGQFVYLRSSFLSSAHPFTIMDYDHQTHTLQFGIKSSGSFTQSLTKLKLNSTVYLDGPYGNFTTQANPQIPTVILAAGIGITPFIRLICENPQNTFLFYSNKTKAHAFKRTSLKKTLNKNYIDLFTQEKVKGKNTENSRISQKIITKYLNQKTLQSANYFICGPQTFIISSKQILLDLKINPRQIFTEEFTL